MLDVVADRFEIRALAGRGAMGEVHRAFDRATGIDVALKTSTAFEHSARFVEEASALARIDHAAVVRYVSHGVLPGGQPFIAMQWIDGVPLQQYLRQNALGQREAVALVGRIARGLGAAHRAGVVHRDVKPSNVMLRGGNLEDPVVVDFGLARRYGEVGITQTGVVVGTPGYMAPEQARGQRDMDARADVFSLGCVLYRALTGQAPFRGKDMVEVLTKILLESPRPLREVIQQCPRELERLVSAMLAKDAELRPADGDAAADLLEAFDWGHRAGEESTSFVLGTREQRVVSIIMTQHDEPALAESAADVMRAQGARVESLLYGGIVGVVAGVGPEQALRSARCAMAVRGVLPEARIALATGRADLSGLSPVGEVIEAATSLLRDGGTAGVRLDDVTRGLLAERFDIEGDVLVAERSGDDGGVRKLMGKATPLVGRAQEMGMLGLFVQRVLDEGAAVMTVTAPAGYGKTRLRSELVRQVEREHPDMVLWRARADVMGTGAPYGLARQLVAYAARIELSDGAETQRAKLSAAVAEHVAPDVRERVAGFLCEMLGCPVERRPDVDLARRDTELMRDQLRRAWTALFIAQVKAAPLLIVLDDLQWCDTPSLGLLDAALDACSELPFGIVAFARPELHTTFGELFAGRSTSDLRLGPLSKRASQELVRFALGDVPADVVARVVDTASGNAFYLEELVRSVATGHGDRLPTSVVAMSQSRLERLDPELRRALRAASIFGSRFWRSGVALLTGGSEVDAAEWLAALERDELVTRVRESRFEGQGELAFRHALMREVAYATLTESDAAVGHGLAATWLEEHGERDAHVLAEHWLKSSERARALPYVVRVTEKARDAGDWDEALRRAEQARVLGATGDELAVVELVTAEAENDQWTGKDVSGAVASAVQQATEGSALWARAVGFAAVLAVRRGDEAGIDRLAAVVMEAHARAPASPEVMTAVAHVAAARMMGGLEASRLIGAIEEAQDDIAAMNLHARLRIEYARVIHGLRKYGTTADERRALRALLEESERIAPGSGPLGMRNNLASAAMAAGRLGEAAADYRFIWDHRKSNARGGNAAFAALQLGQIAIHEGRLDEARSWVHEARDVTPEKSVFADLLVWLQARIALASGQLEEAIALATSVEAGAQQEIGVAARCTAALAALDLGDVPRALSLLESAPASLQHLTTDDVVYVRCARAKVFLAASRDEEARKELDAARALYDGARDAPEENWHLQQVAKLGSAS